MYSTKRLQTLCLHFCLTYYSLYDAKTYFSEYYTHTKEVNFTKIHTTIKRK